MAILTGKEILNRIDFHDIIISPLDTKKLNANSYDLTLDRKAKVIKYTSVDVTRKTETYDVDLGDGGIMLQPNEVYLFTTEEYTETHNLVPMVLAKSSLARDGINLILNGGFGDIGYCGKWTIPCFVIKPTKIIAGIKFCQIFYNTIEGKVEKTYNGNYQGSTMAVSSKLYSQLSNSNPTGETFDFHGFH